MTTDFYSTTFSVTDGVQKMMSVVQRSNGANAGITKNRHIPLHASKSLRLPTSPALIASLPDPVKPQLYIEKRIDNYEMG